jgi:HSP20 family molecular chaperone IbpA
MRTGSSKNTGPIKTIEPATTLIDEGKFLRILTELPGIAEEKIKIDLENSSTSVTIVASDTVIQYKKVITIPCEVRFSKKRFSDGVLELTLEKTNSDNF